MLMKSGKAEGMPYSLSRWTDVPASKWDWFKESLKAGEMIAFDPRTAIPSHWSLRSEDTLGLVFWTKDPTNLIKDKALLAGYKVKVHVTATGWEEMEPGAPTLEESIYLLRWAVLNYGPENVTWRFSPVPMVPDVLHRFNRLLNEASFACLDQVYVSFLQENDKIPETRTPKERLELLRAMALLAGR